MRKAGTVALLCLLGLSFAFAQQKTVGWSLGYYPAWNQQSFPPANINWNAFTHISHFALEPVRDGSLSITNGLTDQFCKDAVAAAHQHNVKILICVGGSGVDTGAFRGACSAANVKKFVSNLIQFMVKYGYDGIDTDWEADFDDSLFVGWHRVLRDSLNRFNPPKLLTAAVEDWFPITGEIYPYVDMMNDMWYGATARSYPGYLQTFISEGAPKSKLGAGIGIASVYNLSAQDCTDLCNMVVNDSDGGVMEWCLSNEGQLTSKLSAIAKFVPTPTSILPENSLQPEMAVAPGLTVIQKNGVVDVNYIVPSFCSGTIMDLGIFSLKGALVKTIFHGPSSAGSYCMALGGTAPGSYIVRLSANNTVSAAKAVVLK